MTHATRRESDALRVNVIQKIPSPGNTAETDAQPGGGADPRAHGFYFACAVAARPSP